MFQTWAPVPALTAYKVLSVDVTTKVFPSGLTPVMVTLPGVLNFHSKFVRGEGEGEGEGDGGGNGGDGGDGGDGGPGDGIGGPAEQRW